MTIKQQGGIFGRNPTFNDVEVDGTLDANKASGVFNSLTASGTQPLTINTTQNNQIKLQVNGANTGQYLSTATYPHWFTDAAGNGDLLKINTSGNLVVNSGSGIDFSATSGTGTSELFDDYEEGNWTPVVAAGAISGTSITYSGSYTKVGNQVTITFKAVNTAGDIQISSYAVLSGLPFAASSNFGGSSTVCTEDVDVFARQGFASVGNGSSNLVLSAAGSASGTVKLIVSLTYLT